MRDRIFNKFRDYVCAAGPMTTLWVTSDSILCKAIPNSGWRMQLLSPGGILILSLPFGQGISSVLNGSQDSGGVSQSFTSATPLPSSFAISWVSSQLHPILAKSTSSAPYTVIFKASLLPIPSFPPAHLPFKLILNSQANTSCLVRSLVSAVFLARGHF